MHAAGEETTTVGASEGVPLKTERLRNVVEPTLILTVLAASLYYFGNYLHIRYSEAIGVPWAIPCTPYECITAGFEVTFAVVAVAGVLVWIWVHTTRPGARLLLGNLPYFVTGVLLALAGLGLVVDETTDSFETLLGAMGLAAGAAALVAGIRRVRGGRTWVEEAARRDWKAWTALGVGFFLAQSVAAEYMLEEVVARTYSGDLEGTPLDASMAAVFTMKDKASPIHGRELEILTNSEGKFYAYDFDATCPSPAHTGEGALCLYVVMESEVESLEFVKVWE